MILITELPVIDKAPAAVGCNITSGTGVDTGLRPQVALALTLTL
jgi:hypothetical protein